MSQVRKLVWAKALAGTPPWLRTTRKRGARAKGIAYEKALAKALPQANYGQWFKYQDASGEAWCQTDLILDLGPRLVVIEAKYTWVLEGHEQLFLKYKPVVEMAMGKPMLGIVACKVLMPGMPGSFRVTGELEEGIELAGKGHPVVFHWVPGARIRVPGIPHQSPIDRGHLAALGL